MKSTTTRERDFRLRAVLLALLTSALSVPASATTLEQMSLTQLVGASVAVVRAKCLGSSALWQSGEIWTETRCQSLETFRGAVPAFFTVHVIGGRVGSFESVVDATPRFHAGDEVVLFLAQPFDGAYGIVAWIEGTFRVLRDRAGRAFLSQESAGVMVYDARKRVFRREGIRHMPLEQFRQTIERLSPAPTSPGSSSAFPTPASEPRP